MGASKHVRRVSYFIDISQSYIVWCHLDMELLEMQEFNHNIHPELSCDIANFAAVYGDKNLVKVRAGFSGNLIPCRIKTIPWSHCKPPLDIPYRERKVYELRCQTT